MTGQSVADKLKAISDQAYLARLWKLSRRSYAVAQFISLYHAKRIIAEPEVERLVAIIYKSGLTEIQARDKAHQLLA